MTALVLRRFTLPTQDGIFHIQESVLPDDVRIQIESDLGHIAEVSMTKAQFRELCRLGTPNPYGTDTRHLVQFQPPIDEE